MIAQLSNESDRTHLFMATSYGCYSNDIGRPFDFTDSGASWVRAINVSSGVLVLNTYPACVCLDYPKSLPEHCPTPLSCYARMLESGTFDVSTASLYEHCVRLELQSSLLTRCSKLGTMATTPAGVKRLSR